MNATLTHLQDQLVGLHSIGVTPGLIDTIKVQVYGQPTPIKHIATTGRLDQGVSVIPYDQANLKPIETALKSGGFNAYVFSKTTVIVSSPPVTGEDKKKSIAHIKKMGEEAKIAVRNIRKAHKQAISELPKAERVSIEKQLQNLTDEAVDLIDQIVQEKCEHL